MHNAMMDVDVMEHGKRRPAADPTSAPPAAQRAKRARPTVPPAVHLPPPTITVYPAASYTATLDLPANYPPTEMALHAIEQRERFGLHFVEVSVSERDHGTLDRLFPEARDRFPWRGAMHADCQVLLVDYFNVSGKQFATPQERALFDGVGRRVLLALLRHLVNCGAIRCPERTFVAMEVAGGIFDPARVAELENQTLADFRRAMPLTAAVWERDDEGLTMAEFWQLVEGTARFVRHFERVYGLKPLQDDVTECVLMAGTLRDMWG